MYFAKLARAQWAITISSLFSKKNGAAPASASTRSPRVSTPSRTNIDAPTEVTADTKEARHYAGLQYFVELRGIEPLTFSLRTKRSTN